MVHEIKCDECQALFLFKPCTIVNNQPDRKHPLFCPYCGRESNYWAELDYRTTFTVGERADLTVY